MERKIGEIFEYNGEWYQCINTGNCSECAFTGKRCYDFSTKGVDIIGDCSGRTFKKLEKVGEPFTIVGKLYQHYKVFDIDNVCGDGFWCVHNYKAKTLTIEIKQTNKDMEEKKLNLKPFDIQKAREGKPVCTRDGRKARIICFDKKCLDGQVLIGLVDCGKEECMYFYTTDGKCIDDFSSFDLKMFPEKKEGWVNIDKGGSGKIAISSPYSTKEEAIHNDNECTIDTIKINWSE